MAVDGTRQKLSMISTVTNQGNASWMIVDGVFNHERLIEFFEALVADGQRAGKKVLLILDNLGAHHCKPVKTWLAQRSDQIEVFYLPSYSPELNTDERLNADLKHAIGTVVPVRTKAKLQAAANEHMAFIDATPSVCGPISRTLVSRTRHEDLFVPDQKARRIEFARGIGY